MDYQWGSEERVAVLGGAFACTATLPLFSWWMMAIKIIFFVSKKFHIIVPSSQTTNFSDDNVHISLINSKKKTYCSKANSSSNRGTATNLMPTKYIKPTKWKFLCQRTSGCGKKNAIFWFPAGNSCCGPMKITWIWCRHNIILSSFPSPTKGMMSTSSALTQCSA